GRALHRVVAVEAGDLQVAGVQLVAERDRLLGPVSHLGEPGREVVPDKSGSDEREDGGTDAQHEGGPVRPLREDLRQRLLPLPSSSAEPLVTAGRGAENRAQLIATEGGCQAAREARIG